MKIKGDICFLGQKRYVTDYQRVGKTSIIKVVFNKQHPHDTQNLDSTAELEACEVDFKGFYKYQVFDFPGFYEADALKDTEMECLRNCGAVIYVVDSKVMIGK